MKKVYVARAAWDAQMIRDLLTTDGIDAFVDPPSEGFKTAYSLMSNRSSSQSVWIVNNEDETRAAQIVDGFRVDASTQAQAPGITWTWRCTRCGEDVEPQFQICWNCGAEHPEG